MDCFSPPPGEVDVAPPPVWPSHTPGPPPAQFKVRAVDPARCHFRDKTLIHSGRMLRAIGATLAPPSRGLVSITRPPRGVADLSFISDTLPAGRFQLNSNEECQRSLESWALAVSPECSAGLWNTPNFEKDCFSCTWVVAECVSESIFCSLLSYQTWRSRNPHTSLQAALQVSSFHLASIRATLLSVDQDAEQ